MIIRSFDVETTGLPDGDKITAAIQVGWTDVLVDEEAGTAVVGETFQMFCDPRRGNPEITIEIGALATHHIILTDLDGAVSVDVALRELAGSAGGCDAFACHNKEHDARYFSGIGKPMICTLKSARNVWPESAAYNNQYLRYALDLPVDRARTEPPHHAGPDSYVTAHLLARMVQEGASLADMLEWTSAPTLLKIMPIGKDHKGKRFEDVPSSFLKWIIRDIKDKPDLVRSAMHHLDLRGDL